MSRIGAGRPRILFLDDDPARAAQFARSHAEAVWVRTAGQCLRCLDAERWDEVHLDHDLGGERFVDHDRDDSGMAVVRWLCRAPRPHLKGTRFVIHTQNPIAAGVMVFHLEVMGFEVRLCPFGSVPEPDPNATTGPARPSVRAIRWLRCLVGNRKARVPSVGGLTSRIGILGNFRSRAPSREARDGPFRH